MFVERFLSNMLIIGCFLKLYALQNSKRMMPKKIETVHLIIIDYYFRYVETMVLRIARWRKEESTSSVHHFNEPRKL